MNTLQPLHLHARPVTPGEVGQKIHEQWVKYRQADLQRPAHQDRKH
ncbi:hypothetical protein [Candidatus Dactylopiibacterium carminicum]|nr:hypothetical protein [Candidatus Dactylopiibacterium carminicum]